MPTVRVSDDRGLDPLEMYYEVHGSGPNRIVLIGGYGNICHQWDLQVGFFMRQPDLFSVCIPDNRGGGLSSSPKGRYTTPEMAMDVKELMDHIKWNRFHVVGLSLGGMIAQELAYLCMDRVISLTLESTFAYFNGLPRKAYIDLVLKGPPLNTVDDFAAHVVNKILFPQEWLNAPAPENVPYATNREHMIAFAKERFEVTGLQNKAGRASQQNAVIKHFMNLRRLSHLKNSQMPVLVICGTKDDVIIQPESSKYLARQLGGRLEIFEGAGHAIRLQFPDKHNEMLKAHILGAVQKEQDRLADRISSSIAALRGICGGRVFETRSAAIKEELEREFSRNGGSHRFIVHTGRIFDGRSRRISLRQSLSSIRRRSRGSLLNLDDEHQQGGAARPSSSLRRRQSRLSLSTTALKTSLHDLFAPVEVGPSSDTITAPVAAIPVEHPSSSSFMSWLFPSLPPLLTIEREVVVEVLEFGQDAFVQRTTTRVTTTTVLSTSDIMANQERVDSGTREQQRPPGRGFRLPTLRAVRIGLSDVVAMMSGTAA
ncbi:Alpha/Beta hydrolase protein [Chytriomyces sp. MP71]|nr:Alpha/Beta hydrolase protein [Chytriomyces sp. MP71]